MKKILNRLKLAFHVLCGRPLAYRLRTQGIALLEMKNVRIVECEVERNLASVLSPKQK